MLPSQLIDYEEAGKEDADAVMRNEGSHGNT
jgi:hypothetical protein